MKIVLGDFNAKASREDIFKPTIRNKSLHKIMSSNDKSECRNYHVPHCNIRKFTWLSPDGKTHNQTDHISINRTGYGIPVYMMSDHLKQ
jgi:hypothetical protein